MDDRTTMEKILHDIDNATCPAITPSRDRALRWLQQLAVEIDTRIDGLRDDIVNDGGDDLDLL